MRRYGWALGAALAIAVAALVPVYAAHSAGASCAAPDISVAPSGGPAGGQARVTGRHFAAACNDVIVCEVDKPCPTPPPTPPATNVPISFVQGDVVTPLATVDAAADYTLNAVVRVPFSARRGAATIVADGQWSAPFMVTIPSGALARTNSRDLRPLAALGVALVVAGGLMTRQSMSKVPPARQ